MKLPHSAAALAIATSLTLAIAQTSTACDPTKKQCPDDIGLNSGKYVADFMTGSGANASWSGAAYTVINYGSQGAEFTIANDNQAPTIQTDFYFLYGRVDVKMQAAPGVGIVSSIVLQSDDLDEIDWEFLGGDTTQCETNFFGKGNTTSYDRAIYYNVQTPQSTFHTYSIDWNSDRLQFIIDGTTVRTISSADPLTVNGKNYPQTPMRVKLGNWAGGGPNEPRGTVTWAGGATDFTKGPFTMYVASVSITNENPACSYTWRDQSGTWDSIKINKSGCSASTSPSGSANGSGSAGSAPSSSVSVVAISGNTGAAVASTVTGSYSESIASTTAHSSSRATRSGSVEGATTMVPGLTPTVASSATATGASASSSGSVASTGTSGATALTGCTAVAIMVGAVVALFTL